MLYFDPIAAEWRARKLPNCFYCQFIDKTLLCKHLPPCTLAPGGTHCGTQTHVVAPTSLHLGSHLTVFMSSLCTLCVRACVGMHVYVMSMSYYFFSIGLIYSMEEDMREAVSDLQAAVNVP